MTPERWQEVQKTFHAVVESPLHERSSLLDELCRGDAELRREVEELLASDGRATGFLEADPALSAEQPAAERPPAARVGPYRILDRIGEGGMSTVHAAVREDEAYEPIGH